MKKTNFFKKINKFFKKHWRKWTILAILGIVVYTGFIFYQYIYKPLYQPKEMSLPKIEIKKQVYQEVMDLYYQRQSNLDKIIYKDYPNLFR